MQLRTEHSREGVALCIPSSLANQASLLPNAVVEVELVNGKLLVSPLARPKITLEELLAGVTDENRHEEIPTGPSVGAEAW